MMHALRIKDFLRHSIVKIHAQRFQVVMMVLDLKSASAAMSTNPSDPIHLSVIRPYVHPVSTISSMASFIFLDQLKS